ncbi:MAG: hypothetical protein IPN86_17620 [Saprospiraceae bacterium]|nr:hypothetical protein [Saprospiraceae bacterium]
MDNSVRCYKFVLTNRESDMTFKIISPLDMIFLKNPKVASIFVRVGVSSAQLKKEEQPKNQTSLGIE